MHQKYVLYEIIDFLTDEDFKRWIAEDKKDKVLSQHWEEVAACLPEKHSIMMAAERRIKNLIRENSSNADAGRHIIWDKISKTIREDDTKKSGQNHRTYIRYSYWGAAGLLLLLSGIGLTFWYDSHYRWEEIVSKNGTIRKVVLPDSSEIYLAANSGVRFSRRWKSDEIREVWLTGDAFFTIKRLKKTSSQRSRHNQFVVHAPNQLDVNVLGTSFEIRSSGGQTSVDLRSGAVELTTALKSCRMNPGDKVVFSPEKSFVLQRGSASLNLDWQNKEMYIDNSPLIEVVSRISRLFDVKIVILNEALYHRRLEGSIPCHTADNAVLALRDILDLSVYKQEDVIYME